MSQLSTPFASTSRLHHPQPTLNEPDIDADRPTKRQRVLQSPASTGSSDTHMSERAPLFPPSTQRGETPTPPARVARPKATDVLGFVRSRLGAHQPYQFAAYVGGLREAYLALHPTTSSGELDDKLEPETRGVEEESKLWLARAEVGLMVLDTAAECDIDSWARREDVQDHVDRAVGKGLVLVQKHVSLRSFKLPFTVASARLSVLQNKTRQALALLKRQVATALPTDPPAQTYRAHLALVSHLFAIDTDVNPALAALANLAELAGKKGDTNVQTLCKVERLRMLAASDCWADAFPALQDAEDALGLTFAADHPIPQPSSSEADSQNVSATTSTAPSNVPPPRMPTTPWQSALIVYTLMLGSMAWTHVGQAARTSVRVAFLHRVMDVRTSWEKDGQTSRGTAWQFGAIDIPLGSASEVNASKGFVTVQSTHPTVLFRLTFLATAASKRDPVLPASNGRDSNGVVPASEPKRRTFAREGLAVADKPIIVDFAPCTPLAHARDLQDSFLRMRAQLLLELVGVALSRHELDEAERRLAQLVAYLRNTKVGPPVSLESPASDKDDTAGTLWLEFAPLVFLSTGNLAQAQLRPRRASASYQAAVTLSGTNIKLAAISLAAQAADLAVRIGHVAAVEDDWTSSEPVSTSPSKGKRGFKRKRPATTTTIDLEQDEERWPALLPPSSSEAANLVSTLLEHSSAALQAIGHVLAACTDITHTSSQESSGSNSADILKTKNHLKTALEISTNAHDNALRAEVLALTSSLYAYTAPQHANVMLRRARDLARELGASGLAAWVVRRVIEVSKLNGKESRVPKLEEELADLEGKTRSLRERPWFGAVSAAASKKQKR